MSDLRPLYVVGPPSPLRDRVLARFPASSRVADGPSELFGDGPVDPGVVLLLEDGLAPEDVLATVESLAPGKGEWTCCLVRERDGEAVVRTVSLGWVETLDALEAFLEGDDDRLLELRRALERVARARHDINNPLTSGMAEVQLMLMDSTEPDTRQALGVVLTQLRRIRDLVAATGGLRPGED